MKKAVKYIILSLAALAVIGTFVFLFKKSRPEVVVYQELEAKLADIRRTTVVTGKIEPRNEVNIKPQINGIISELYKEAGQTVKENEVIARLKVIPDMSSLSAAESRVRLAELNLNQAKIDFDREKTLYDKNLVSAEEYDKVVQTYNQAKEERAAAQDALEVIRDGVSSANATGSSTLVRSTISGLILDIPVKVGKHVMFDNAKTLIADPGRCFMKFVANAETRELLGAQLMCEHSSDMIGGVSQALANRMSAESFHLAMRPHPSFEEAMTAALEDLCEKLG